MPHHWRPVDPGNPDCETVAAELLDRYGRRLKYVGFDGEFCWALIESGGEDEEGFREEDPLKHQCERRNLQDAYVKDQGVSQA